jgi:hypothetical protein
MPAQIRGARLEGKKITFCGKSGAPGGREEAARIREPLSPLPASLAPGREFDLAFERRRRRLRSSEKNGNEGGRRRKGKEMVCLVLPGRLVACCFQIFIWEREGGASKAAAASFAWLPFRLPPTPRPRVGESVLLGAYLRLFLPAFLVLPRADGEMEVNAVRRGAVMWVCQRVRINRRVTPGGSPCR